MNTPRDKVLNWVHSCWPQWFGESPGALRTVELQGGKTDEQRVLLFVFNDRHATPRAFLKIGLSEADRPSIENEFSTLQALHGTRLSRSDIRLPAAHGLYSKNGLTVAAYGVLLGRRLLVPKLTARVVLTGKNSMRRFWHTTGRFGAEIAQHTPMGGQFDQNWLVERIDRFRSTYAADLKQEAALRAFASAVASARLAANHRWQHGDMAVGNVLVTKDGMQLVDWESAASSYEPWFDLSSSPAASIILASRQQPMRVEDASRIILPERHWTGGLMKEAITERWEYEIPIGWGIALSTMQRALRRPHVGTNRSLPYARIALAMLVDEELRKKASWAVPTW